MTQPITLARDSSFTLDGRRRTGPTRPSDRRAHRGRRLSTGLHFLVAVSCLTVLVMITGEVPEELASYPRGVLRATAALFCVGAISSMALIRRIPHTGLDGFDPGLLLVLFVFSSIAPLIVSSGFGEPLLRFQDVRLEPLLPRVVLLHLILVVAFATTYYLVNRKSRRATSVAPGPFDSLTVSMWILLAFVMVVVTFSIESVRGVLLTRTTGDSTDISRAFLENMGLAEQQAIQLLRALRAYTIAFAFGVLACRAATPHRSIGILLACILPLGLVYFSLFASRGFLLSTMLIAASFVDARRFNGNLLTMKTLVVGLVGAMAMLQLMDAGENLWVYGHAPGADDLRKAVVLDYGIVENSAIMVDWIDTGAEAHWYGSSYWTALVSVLPTQIRGPIIGLPTWFSTRAIQLYEPNEVGTGKGKGFSAVAEGYLNWGTPGVAIQGAILALIASVIRFFRVSRRLGSIGPYLFAASLPLSYTLFRMDVSGVLSRLKNSVIHVVILAVVASLIVAVGRRFVASKRAKPRLSVHAAGRSASD